MILSDLKAVCAAYLNKASADLTVNSVDLFLVAANNVRKGAELLHNFELARLSATLDIDAVTGGAVSAAVIAGDLDVVTVTGTLTPDITGTYTRAGSFNNYPMYVKAVSTGSYFVYYNTGLLSYIISSTLGTTAPSAYWKPTVAQTTIAGTYPPTGSITGTATVALSTSSFSGIKEIVAISALRSNGDYIPMDFTRADISIARDHRELELSDDYWPANRYPSDAQFLNRGGGAGLVLRGGSIYQFPRTTDTSGDSLPITIEGFGWLRDYVAADLSDTLPSDFFLEFGHEYLQWGVILEMNHRFKWLVPRQEGNLSEPTRYRDEAWRKLLLWDTYLIDPNSTRSR